MLTLHLLSHWRHREIFMINLTIATMKTTGSSASRHRAPFALAASAEGSHSKWFDSGLVCG